MSSPISAVPGAGVTWTVPGGRRPGLRFEVAAGNRMLLRQQSSIVFFARVHQRQHGVDVRRTGTYEAPLPPLRADLVRRIAASRPGSPTWLDRWSRRFVDWLVTAEAGPLYGGTWTVRPRELPVYCLTSDLVVDFPTAYLDWLGRGWNGVLPLRELAHRDAGRVKAYRKQAQDGTLPPILLWAVRGLDGYLLLDGHSRLVAARAEQVRPVVLVLTPSATGGPGADRRTRAWPMPGGVVTWEREHSEAQTTTDAVDSGRKMSYPAGLLAPPSDRGGAEQR